MKITANWSNSDWQRVIPNVIISLIPIIFLALSVFYLYIPYIVNFTTFLNFQTQDEIIVRFINYLESNSELQTGLLTPDGWLIFFLLAWLGAMIFPLLLILRFIRLIPVKWIIKKLDIENRMKLIIFINGKPLTKFRQLFGK